MASWDPWAGGSSDPWTGGERAVGWSSWTASTLRPAEQRSACRVEAKGEREQDGDVQPEVAVPQDVLEGRRGQVSGEAAPEAGQQGAVTEGPPCPAPEPTTYRGECRRGNEDQPSQRQWPPADEHLEVDVVRLLGELEALAGQRVPFVAGDAPLQVLEAPDVAFCSGFAEEPSDPGVGR
jgi:hypothetical protein